MDQNQRTGTNGPNGKDRESGNAHNAHAYLGTSRDTADAGNVGANNAALMGAQGGEEPDFFLPPIAGQSAASYADPALYAELEGDPSQLEENNQVYNMKVGNAIMEITKGDMERMLQQIDHTGKTDDLVDDELEADLRELALTSSAISKKLNIQGFSDNDPFGKDFAIFLTTDEPPEIEDLHDDAEEDDKVAKDNGLSLRRNIPEEETHMNSLVDKYAWKSYIPPKEGPGLILENTSFYHHLLEIKKREHKKRLREKEHARRLKQGGEAGDDTKKSRRSKTSGDKKRSSKTKPRDREASLISNVSLTSGAASVNMAMDDIDRLFEEAQRKMNGTETIAEEEGEGEDEDEHTGEKRLGKDTQANEGDDEMQSNISSGKTDFTSLSSLREDLNNVDETKLIEKKDEQKMISPTTPTGLPDTGAPKDGSMPVPPSRVRGKKALPIIPGQQTLTKPIDTNIIPKSTDKENVQDNKPKKDETFDQESHISASAFVSSDSNSDDSKPESESKIAERFVGKKMPEEFYIDDDDLDTKVLKWAEGVYEHAPKAQIADSTPTKASPFESKPSSASLTGAGLNRTLSHDGQSSVNITTDDQLGSEILSHSIHTGVTGSGVRRQSDMASDMYSTEAGRVRHKPVSKSQKIDAVQNIFTDKQKIAYVGLCYLSIIKLKEERLSLDKKSIKRAAASFDRWASKFMSLIYIYLDISKAEQDMITNMTLHGLIPEDLANPMIEEVQKAAELLEQRQMDRQKIDQDRMDAGLPPLLDEDDTKLDIDGNGELTDVRYTILTHLFIISISEGKYDSRSRAILKQVGVHLDVPVLDILRLEATIGEQLRMYDDSKGPQKDENVVKRRNKADVRRRWIATGVAALAGGAVIGLTAGLAAPLIAGGIGVALTTIGISGAGSVMASTGAVALITTGGILTGGGMGGTKMMKRLKGVEEFEFVNVAEAKQGILVRKEKRRREIFRKRRREAREAIIKRLQRNNSPFVHTPIKTQEDSTLFNVFDEYPGVAKTLGEPPLQPLVFNRKSSMSTSDKYFKPLDGLTGIRRGSSAVGMNPNDSSSKRSDISGDRSSAIMKNPGTQVLRDAMKLTESPNTSQPNLVESPSQAQLPPYEEVETTETPTNRSQLNSAVSGVPDTESESQKPSKAKLPPPIPSRPTVIQPREMPSTHPSVAGSKPGGNDAESSMGGSTAVNDTDADNNPNPYATNGDQPGEENLKKKKGKIENTIPDSVLEQSCGIETSEARNLLDELQSTVAGETVAGDRPQDDGMIFKDDEEERPHQSSVLISVAGWLTHSNDDYILPFSTLEEGIYGDHYGLVWESKVLMDLGSALSLLVSEIASFLFQQGLQATILSTLMIGLAGPTWTMKLAYLIDNPWGIGISKASKIGKVLADLLIQGVQEDRPVTLVGYSLGARVVYHCLLELSSRGAFGIVEEAYLFGCPVMASKKDWTALSSVVSGRVVNGYCQNDMVLGILYRASTAVWSDVAGLRPIKDVPGVENLDLSEIVKGHLDYRLMLPQVLQMAGFQVTADHFSDED